MDKLTSNEFEKELDKTLGGLGLDLMQAKQIYPTGITYNFFWDGLPFYIFIPDQSYTGVLRLEVEFSEFDELDAGRRVVYSVSCYLTIHDCSLVRVVPKPTKEQKVKILLQTVGIIDWFQPGFIGSVIIHMAELATYFRKTMAENNQNKVA